MNSSNADSRFVETLPVVSTSISTNIVGTADVNENSNKGQRLLSGPSTIVNKGSIPLFTNQAGIVTTLPFQQVLTPSGVMASGINLTISNGNALQFTS